MHILTVVVFLVTFALGVLGNGLVLWVTAFCMKRTVNTVWYFSLAMADFPFTLLLPLSAAYQVLGTHWPFGLAMCKLTSGLSVLTMFASVLTLVAISVDRCVAVVFPVWSQNRRGPGLAMSACGLVWLLSVALSSPTFVYRDTFQEGNSTICFTNFLTAKEEASLELLEDDDEEAWAAIDALTASRFFWLSLSQILGGFVLPFTVIGVSYAILCLRLRHHRLASRPGGSKPFRIMATVVTAFLVCWLPYHTILLTEICLPVGEPLPLALELATPLASGLAALNSCLNPLLYIWAGRHFRVRLCHSLPRILEQALTEDTGRSSKTRSSLLGEGASTIV
ncbi:chemokine-like receptor 1 [Chiloscyllium plagiosum]|uniref:chemokine-like receptor 1 n=1 Tax=Chiloscyllium plagiosum TaxID=36176 RepID=UPI001CB7F79D|nr:chemokine-like receptor 1 [Chiloscyllium plagiosum]